SKEIMGALALAIVWVNTLLIVAAAWIELRKLSRRVRGLRWLAPGERGTGLVAACVLGEEPIACHRVEQIGRSEDSAAEAQPAILFADRPYGGVVRGGPASLVASGEVVILEPADGAEVWVGADRIRADAACASVERFDEAYADARKARGFARTIEAQIR